MFNHFESDNCGVVFYRIDDRLWFINKGIFIGMDTSSFARY